MKIPKPTLSTIWLVLPVVLTLLIVWTNNQFPLDFWLHVNSGRWMCESGRLIAVDTFTHTIFGQPVLNQPWLAQLVMYQSFKIGGYPVTQFVLGSAYGAAIGLVTLLTYQRCRDSRVTAAVMIAAVAVAATNMAIRPQAFSVLLFAVELYALSVWGARRIAPWIVACVELLWTNMHGAFPLGVVLPGIFLAGALGEIVWRSGSLPLRNPRVIGNYFYCCVLASITMLINPQGLVAMQYVSGVTSKATERHIEEWLPTSMDSTAGTAFMVSVAASMLLICISRRPMRLTDALLLAAFFVVGAKSQRMVIWWALVFPAILAPQVCLAAERCQAGARAAWAALQLHASRWTLFEYRRPINAAFARLQRVCARNNDHHTSDVVNWIAAASLCLLLTASTPWTRTFNPLLPPSKRQAVPVDEPRDAVRFLASSGLSGRLYQPMEWGSYVSWQLDPRIKVFVDSRIDFFPDQVWNDYVSIGTRPDQAISTLDKYGVNLVLWDPRRSRTLPAVLNTSPDWHRLYADPHSVVFGRR